MALPFHPVPKPEARVRTKGRERRAVLTHVKAVRVQAFEDGGHACVVCGWRAESLHEDEAASVVGDRVKATYAENSWPVCGSGTTGCHGLLQGHLIWSVDIKGERRFMVEIRAVTHPEIKELWRRVAMAQQREGATR